MAVKKVVLAYSGGLDTSIIVPWLKENYDCEVIAYCGDVGQGGRPRAASSKKALATGASKCYVRGPARGVRARLRLPDPPRRRGLRAASTCSAPRMARPLIAKRQVEVALLEGADARRPRLHRQGQRPGPLRADLLAARAAAQGHRALARVGHPLPRGRARLRGRARHPGHGQPRRKIYSAATATSGTSRTRAACSRIPGTRRRGRLFNLTVAPEDAPDTPEYVTIGFEQGVPVALDGQQLVAASSC